MTLLASPEASGHHSPHDGQGRGWQPLVGAEALAEGCAPVERPAPPAPASIGSRRARLSTPSASSTPEHDDDRSPPAACAAHQDHPRQHRRRRAHAAALFLRFAFSYALGLKARRADHRAAGLGAPSCSKEASLRSMRPSRSRTMPSRGAWPMAATSASRRLICAASGTPPDLAKFLELFASNYNAIQTMLSGRPSRRLWQLWRHFRNRNTRSARARTSTRITTSATPSIRSGSTGR